MTRSLDIPDAHDAGRRVRGGKEVGQQRSDRQWWQQRGGWGGRRRMEKKWRRKSNGDSIGTDRLACIVEDKLHNNDKDNDNDNDCAVADHHCCQFNLIRRPRHWILSWITYFHCLFLVYIIVKSVGVRLPPPPRWACSGHGWGGSGEWRRWLAKKRGEGKGDTIEHNRCDNPLGAPSFSIHFCMTGTRPLHQMRWSSGPNANETMTYSNNS